MQLAIPILVIAYHILRDGTVYSEIGSDYLDNLNAEYVKKQLVRRLESLGLIVKVEPVPVAA